MGMNEMFRWKTAARGMPQLSTEQTGAYNGGLGLQSHGLLSGTKVASNLGWRCVEALAVGDSVLTFDNGMQKIVEFRRQTLFLSGADAAPGNGPLIVPVGALGNRTEITLLPDQGVLVESDMVADIYGDPFAVIPAHSLEGFRGITRAGPAQEIELITLCFEEEEVIYAEGGALIYCPRNALALDGFLDAELTDYTLMSAEDAANLVGWMEMQDMALCFGGVSDRRMAAVC